MNMEDRTHTHRHGKGAKLRRMQTEIPTSSRPRDGDQRPGSGFWETVLNQPTNSTKSPSSTGVGLGSLDSSHSRRHRQSSHSTNSGGRGELNQKIYHCQLCSVTFSQKSHLTQHSRTVHERLRPHKCDQCDMAFAKRYDLTSHVDAVHSKERPYECPTCRKTFAKKSNLTRHISYIHEKTPSGKGAP